MTQEGGSAPPRPISGGGIFTNMSVSYDLSHRRGPRVKQRSPIPDFPAQFEAAKSHSNTKAWVARQRREAQDLTESLSRMEREAEVQALDDPNEFTSETLRLERLFSAYLKTLEAFTARAETDNPERAVILKRASEFYTRLAAEVGRLKSDFERKFAEAEAEVASTTEEKQKLRQTLNEATAALEKRERAAEALRKQLQEVQTKCANADAQLKTLATTKGSAETTAQWGRSRVSELEERAAEKQAQMDKAKEIIDALGEELEKRRREAREIEAEILELERGTEDAERESTELAQEIVDRAKKRDELRNAPVKMKEADTRKNVSVQADRLAQEEKLRAPKRDEGPKINDFDKVKDDMAKVLAALGCKNGLIVIRSKDDLKRIRDVILKNNGLFDYSPQAVLKAQTGDFILGQCSVDEAALFAAGIMKRIMGNVLRSQEWGEQAVQTDPVEEVKEESESEEDPRLEKLKAFRGAPQSLFNVVKNSRFVGMLTSDCTARGPKPFDWVIRTIRSIYDEKTVDDRTNEREGTPVTAIPEYILVWGFRQFGSDDRIQKACWDLFVSAHHHMQRYLEVMIFVKFLDEVWTTDQLSLFLKLRTWCLQRCVSIPIEHIELDEYFTETYMTKSQVAEFFRVHFGGWDPEIVDEMIIKGCACADPERGNENETSCIPMLRILEIAVSEYLDSRVRRLRQMLALFRPVPIMKLKRFSIYAQSLIPNIDADTIESLYESSVLPNTIRCEKDQEEFTELFHSEDPIVPDDYDSDSFSCDEFAVYSRLYQMVLIRWKQFSPFLTKLLKVNKQGSPEVRMIFNEIRHQTFQLLDAMVGFDGMLFYRAYHRLLQTVIRNGVRLRVPDAFSFGRHITAIEGFLDQKFGNACDSDSYSEEEDGY